MASTANTPRSSQRSKRSTTNLSDLRLAPLSTKFAEPPRNYIESKSTYEAPTESSFASHHSSYIQGKSAPTTPGILSRNSSRRHLGGGLSRRLSIYGDGDEAASYTYAAASRDGRDGSLRVDVGSGQIPKAKSEAALLARQRLPGQGFSMKKRPQGGERTGGVTTPRPKRKVKGPDNDWLTRTGAATSALMQESKGQLWLASRQSSTSLANQESDDDDQYEEMAALSASTTRLQVADDEFSPTTTRVSRWGSRYGSRSVSRRQSRRGSVSSLRAPTAGADVIPGYFDEDALAFPTEPDFVDVDEEDDTADEREISRLTQERSFGLGGLVDRLMGFNLFNVAEREESTTEEDESSNETEAQRNVRTEVAAKRKDAEEKVVAPPSMTDDGNGEQQQGWQDAAWLLSVASRAMFQD